MLPLHGLPSRVALPRTVPVWPAWEDLNAKVYVMVLLAVPGEPSVWAQGWVLLQEPPVIAESVAPLGPPDMYPIVYVPNG